MEIMHSQSSGPRGSKVKSAQDLDRINQAVKFGCEISVQHLLSYGVLFIHLQPNHPLGCASEQRNYKVFYSNTSSGLTYLSSSYTVLPHRLMITLLYIFFFFFCCLFALEKTQNGSLPPPWDRTVKNATRYFMSFQTLIWKRISFNVEDGLINWFSTILCDILQGRVDESGTVTPFPLSQIKVCSLFTCPCIGLKWVIT